MIFLSYFIKYQKFKALWDQNPLIVPDTNVLLRLYRYSPQTLKNILELLNSIRGEIWLADQVIKEFNKNHKDVVNKEKKKFRAVKSEINRVVNSSRDGLISQFKIFNKHWFPKTRELETKVLSLIEQIEKEAKDFEENIDIEIKENEKMLAKDEVKMLIDTIINSGNVGSPFPFSELLGIYKEGEFRYAHLIPPGYKDIPKDKTDDTKRQKFGDLIFWKQVLLKAKQSERPIILVTLDDKEDWWEHDLQGKIISMKDDLILEFKDYSDQEFIMMSLNNLYLHLATNNTLEQRLTEYELFAADVAEDLKEHLGIESLLRKELFYFLEHSSEFQEHVKAAQYEVEITDYTNFKITDAYVDFYGNKVSVDFVVEGSIDCEIEIPHHDDISGSALIEANVNVEFELPVIDDEEIFLARAPVNSEENAEEDVAYSFDLSQIVSGTLTHSTSNIHVINSNFSEHNEGCIHCGMVPAEHRSPDDRPVCYDCIDNYSYCPDCGQLFEQGTIGAKCSACED